MKLNEGTIDRVIRVIAGVALLVIGVALLKGVLGVVLDVLGAILVITGIVGFCPLYALFGITTASKS